MKFWMILLFILPATVFSQKTYTYKNLVLEGGGVRGLAYGGALEILEQKGVLKNIENVAGSSAGAIAGLMVALNYNSHEIDSVLQGLKIQEFNDGKFITGKIRRVKKEYGIFKGDKFDKWLGDLIANKTGNADITFSGLNELHLRDKNFRNFFCTGTNVTEQRLEILSYKKWPHMKLRTAVHISSSIPFYFVPIAINKDGHEVSLEDTSQEVDLYVDGGVTDNQPIGPLPKLCRRIIASHVNPIRSDYDSTAIKDVAERTYSLAIYENEKPNLKKLRYVIDPPELANFGLFDFQAIDEIVQIGYVETRRLIGAGKLR